MYSVENPTDGYTIKVYYKEKSLSLGVGGWNKFSERLLYSRLYDFMVSKHYYYLKREKNLCWIVTLEK